jgi:oleate hydratase
MAYRHGNTPAGRLFMTDVSPSAGKPAGRTYMIGGGIAAMAAAAFMIRDGDVAGHTITILDAARTMGGSLDAGGTPDSGYTMRGGRMLESKYVCTFGLFASIPTLDGHESVTAETLRWNETMQTSSKSRLFRHGERETAPSFGLSERDILAIERLVIEPESVPGRTRISDRFDAAFFTTDFWFMWCTTFAFQPWHSAIEFRRYLLRFAHMVSGFDRLQGILRTVFNQYDSLVRPLAKYLAERGVEFALDTRVTDLALIDRNGATSVGRIDFVRTGLSGSISVGADDDVLVTLGSMTEGSTVGDNDHPAKLQGKDDNGAWQLWERIAAGRPEFGRPSVFFDDIAASKWLSFTTTMHDQTLLRLVRDATGNVPGEGGLITFPDSAWLASIVIPHQPHFLGQPDDVSVFWGYGLHIDAPGNFVSKPMSACSGREIMTEILGHLGIKAQAKAILADAVCIPCMMPFITSQFMPRGPGDRPAIVPHGTRHLGFIGQFCELPGDVVFTVEYSIRSAQSAVYALLDLQADVPALYHGAFDPAVVFKAFLALHDVTT